MIKNFKLSIFNPLLSFTEEDKHEIEEAFKCYSNKNYSVKLIGINKDHFIFEANGDLNTRVTQNISRYLRANCSLSHLYSTQSKRLFKTK